MESSCNMQSPQCLRILKRSLLLLTMLTAKTHCIQELAEPVSGNVTFQCPVDKNKVLEFVYVQQNDKFVNGYHSVNPLNNKWKNTKMDENFTFYMSDLERSNSGRYECIIMYKNAKDPVKLEYNLTVTEPYSKPSFTKECNNRNDIRSCQVTCMSQDGFPSQKIVIQVQNGNDNNGMVTSRNDSVFNLTTKLFSSTVTAEVNCSNQEVEFVCSVGGIVSETISICSPSSYPTNIIVAGFVSLAVLLMVAVILIYKKCKRAQSDNGPRGNPEEVVTLKQEESKEEYKV